MRGRVRQHSKAEADSSFGGSQSFSSRAPALAQAATRSAGEPLGSAIRSDMEQRFGHDFGHVRVHADDRAAASAALLSAPAFTTGSDIVFGGEEYAPQSDDGRELLAHELAHVVQGDHGALAGSPPIDEGLSDSAEQGAETLAHAATHDEHAHGHTHSGPCECPTCRAERGLPPVPGTEEQSCGCKGKSEGAGASAGSKTTAAPNETNGVTAASAASVHRAPFEPRRDPGGSRDGHTAGDDYQGPHGAVTRDENPAKLGDSTFLGGMVSYGCYCGPGGKDDTGSRCGANASAVDEIDEQCRQHDANYHMRKVDSGDAPGTHNMFTSLQGWLDAADADQQLASSVANTIDKNPGAYSSSAKLYGQGIKGIFGGRAALSGGYQWGSDRYNQASSGLSGAYDDASSFLSDRYDTGAGLIGNDLSAVSSFADSTVNQASSGVSNFLSSASNWGSASDAAGGLLGGASDALSFVGNTEFNAAKGVLGGASDLLGFASDTAHRGNAGVLDAASRGSSFIQNTSREANQGLTQGAMGIQKWGADTTSAIQNVGFDMLGKGASSIFDQVSTLPPSAIGGPLSAAPPVQDWLKSLW